LRHIACKRSDQSKIITEHNLQTMKKFYLFIFTTITICSFSQKDYSRYYNSWRLGLNVGAAWQTADVRSTWGMAGGITLEKGFHENATNAFSFAVRARYLGANTYGMDSKRNYNVKTNNAYNGTYNPIVNYSDSVSSGKQYVYDNYKMTLSEGSLELQLTFNRLREKTHVLLNLWGGVGFTSYRTMSDLLNGDGKRYDFSKIDSTGNQSTTINSYNTLIDKKYESYALGSKSGNLVTFSPSAGVGLGYQFSPAFSMILEYKVTVPQGVNADYLDGKLSANTDKLGGNNDYYHYAGINFLFTLGGKNKTNQPPRDENAYTNTVVPTTNSTVPTNTLSYSPPTPTVNTLQKPIIIYINPSSNGQITYNAQYKISAQILNVSNSNQIKLHFNSNPVPNFNYNAQTHILEYYSNLNLGINYIQIIATNSVGTDNKSTTVIYQQTQQQYSVNPPTVDITSPSNCPFTTQSAQYNVVANSSHVLSKNNITIKINNVATTNFNFNTTNGQITFPLNLLNGNNDITISVSNNYGNDVTNCNIIYTQPVVQEAVLPVITFINPPQSGYVSANQSYVVNAQVLNVPGKNNISLYYNGLSIPFTYNSSTKQLSFTANLNNGSNSIAISAYNSAGEDNKTTTVNYNTQVPIGNPPVVNLISPVQINNNAATQIYNFKMSLLNVNSKNDISVIYNGVVITNFTYNAITKEVDFTSNLISGTNSLFIKGTNTYGNDFKTVTVNYQPRIAQKSPPQITFINPYTSPINVSGSTYVYKANITNVPSSAGLIVKYNGSVVTNYTYNGSGLIYNATLNTGSNVLEITATNTDGNDLKSAYVNYSPKANPTPPIVSLINPATAVNSTDNLLYNFKLSVLNVNTQNDIEVTFNGAVVTNFTFNLASKIVDFTDNLQVGNNTLVVKGTNSYGVDFKTINVTYTPHVDIKLPPMITFINPAISPASSSSSNYNYKATIGNMPTNSGITVKYNGNIVTNYNYDGYNLDFITTLNSGANTLEIDAINYDGNDVKTATVNYHPRNAPRPPVVTIINPINTPTVNTSSYLFNFSATNVSQNQLSVSLNGNSISGFSFTGNLGSFTGNLIGGNNVITVSASNADGTDSKTGQLYYDVAVDNSTVTTNPLGHSEITICHIPPGNNQNPITITIPVSAWPAHQAHGDTQGACPVTTSTIVICHIPPGNNQNPQTITIPVSAWPAHQAHGDTQGPCPVEIKKSNTPGTTIIPRGTNPTNPVNPVKTTTPEVKDPNQKIITEPLNAPRRPR
jgi:hypothetical protein